MTDPRTSVDRIAGRIYTRVLAVFTGLVSAGMLVAAVISVALSGLAAAWIWMLGAALFGVVARVTWRSRAPLSDVDFSS